MQLKVVASSSEGNCYILESDTQALIIECGKSYKGCDESIKFQRIEDSRLHCHA